MMRLYALILQTASHTLAFYFSLHVKKNTANTCTHIHAMCTRIAAHKRDTMHSQVPAVKL